MDQGTTVKKSNYNTPGRKPNHLKMKQFSEWVNYQKLNHTLEMGAGEDV